MFYYLEGKLYLPDFQSAVIDCGGVGYKLTVSSSTRQEIASKNGQTVRLYTYLSVREDAMELFGFATEKEEQAYEMLIGVSGIGPKAAIAILSTMTVEHLQKAVLTGDVKAISQANGVGGKTAARVVLELKDKMSKEFGILPDELPEVPDTGDTSIADVVNALMVLGYTRSEATAALKKMNVAGKSTEELIREGLKLLSKA